MKLPVDYTKLTPKQKKLVRKEYIRKQENKCMYCGHSLEYNPPYDITCLSIDWSLFPPNFLKYPIHLQHSHVSNLTEGAIHAYCNAVLWQYENK